MAPMLAWTPGWHQNVTPHLIVSDGARAVQFYCRAFGARELCRFCTRQGKIAHAELQLEHFRISLSDESTTGGAKSARSYGGCAMMLRVYTDDVETLARNFLGAGGFVAEALRDQAYGDRAGQFRDPEGYLWMLAQHIEDVRPEQLEQRLNALGISWWRPRPDEHRRAKPPSSR
jgi:PhnB protein